MRALNICRLLSLAILLNHGEASDAAEKEGKEMDEHGRKLNFGWQYWDQHYQYNPYAHTARPTPRPTFVPTPFPTPRPTPLPTSKPTYSPTAYPSPRPTPHPTARPSPRPTKPPTGHPIPLPTRKPTPNPTPKPTPSPTIRPTPGPTRHPTYKPTKSPTERPTPVPTPFPTPSPTPVPTTLKPTNRPTPSPTGDEPSEEPTETSEPSEEPTETTEPSVTPTSYTSFSGSSTLSFESGCVGTNTLCKFIVSTFVTTCYLICRVLCSDSNSSLIPLLLLYHLQLTLFVPISMQTSWEIFVLRSPLQVLIPCWMIATVGSRSLHPPTPLSIPSSITSTTHFSRTIPTSRLRPSAILFSILPPSQPQPLLPESCRLTMTSKLLSWNQSSRTTL